MKRLGALLLVVAALVTGGVVAAQTLGASPSTSIPPITVEQAGPEPRHEPSRAAKPSRKDERQGEEKPSPQDPGSAGLTGGAEPVSPIPVPAGDDDDDDDGADDSDDVDDDDGVPDSDDVDDDDGVPD